MTAGRTATGQDVTCNAEGPGDIYFPQRLRRFDVLTSAGEPAVFDAPIHRGDPVIRLRTLSSTVVLALVLGVVGIVPGAPAVPVSAQVPADAGSDLLPLYESGVDSSGIGKCLQASVAPADSPSGDVADYWVDWFKEGYRDDYVAPTAERPFERITCRYDLTQSYDQLRTGLRNEASDDSSSQSSRKLDVYIPQVVELSQLATAPVLFFVHGGAFSAMSKNSAGFEDWAGTLAEQGIVVVSVNYTLRYTDPSFADALPSLDDNGVVKPLHWPGSPGWEDDTTLLADSVTCSDPLEGCQMQPWFDSANALVWAHENIFANGVGDPGRVTVMGASAGAHIAQMLATSPIFLWMVGMSRGVWTQPLVSDYISAVVSAGFPAYLNLAGDGIGDAPGQPGYDADMPAFSYPYRSNDRDLVNLANALGKDISGFTPENLINQLFDLDSSENVGEELTIQQVVSPMWWYGYLGGGEMPPFLSYHGGGQCDNAEFNPATLLIPALGHTTCIYDYDFSVSPGSGHAFVADYNEGGAYSEPSRRFVEYLEAEGKHAAFVQPIISKKKPTGPWWNPYQSTGWCTAHVTHTGLFSVLMGGSSRFSYRQGYSGDPKYNGYACTLAMQTRTHPSTWKRDLATNGQVAQQLVDFIVQADRDQPIPWSAASVPDWKSAESVADS
ncbi:MAG: hypothetical protein JJLCMIEE_02100 [Acidimicrobiales bacterium]|nr:hypothetical protein [Acidimicrobiales bacterium]